MRASTAIARVLKAEGVKYSLPPGCVLPNALARCYPAGFQGFRGVLTLGLEMRRKQRQPCDENDGQGGTQKARTPDRAGHDRLPPFAESSACCFDWRDYKPDDFRKSTS